MKELLITFFAWFKKTLAKESLFALLALLLAAIFSWIAQEFWLKYTNKEIGELEISHQRYKIYLVVSFMLIVYGIRFVESMIKTVLIKKEKKE